MWTVKSRLVNSDNVSQMSILQSDRLVTYGEVIQLWQEDLNFRTFFIFLLVNSPYKAYFWETPPITQETCDRPFELVLVNNLRLAKVKPNYRSFQQYFQSQEDVVTFANLRKDASLVVPRPLTKESAYPHLAAFVRNAPEEQQHLLWQTLGKEIKLNLSQKPLWVSTSGLGVYWLHIRLDSYPKYYSYEPYRVANLKHSTEK